MALPVRRHEMQPDSTAQFGPSGSALWPMPWSEFGDLQERMGRLLANLVGGHPSGADRLPGLDLEETEDSYLAELELPGVAKDDVNVELIGDQVRVHGAIKERERTGILRRRTRQVGAFDYSFTVPGEIEPDRSSADLTDGVLTVRLPKAAGSRPARVKINVA